MQGVDKPTVTTRLFLIQTEKMYANGLHVNYKG